MSFCSFLSSKICFVGADLPLVRREYAFRADSYAWTMLSRRSSSSITRWTYGLYRA